MDRSRTSRPALPFAFAVLAGVAAGARLQGGALSVATAGTVAAIGASLVPAGRMRRGAALVAVAALAAAAAAHDADRTADARARLCGPDPGFRDVEIVGRVLAAPEPRRDGSRSLRVDGVVLEGSRLPGAVRLTIAPSPPGPTGALDRLACGDRVRAWCRLGVPAPFRNPGHADPAAVLAARGEIAVGHVKSARLVERLEAGGLSWRRAVDLLRSALRRRLSRIATDPDTRAVLAAMLLGDRSEIADSTWRDARDAGLAHLLAISGLHVSLLLAVLLSVVSRAFGWGTRAAVLELAAIALLAELVGGQAPVLRAALAVTIAVAGRSVGRESDPLNTLGLLAGALALARPAIVGQPGFRLSFLATAGLVGLGRRWAAAIPGPPTRRDGAGLVGRRVRRLRAVRRLHVRRPGAPRGRHERRGGAAGGDDPALGLGGSRRRGRSRRRRDRGPCREPERARVPRPGVLRRRKRIVGRARRAAGAGAGRRVLRVARGRTRERARRTRERAARGWVRPHDRPRPPRTRSPPSARRAAARGPGRRPGAGRVGAGAERRIDADRCGRTSREPVRRRRARRGAVPPGRLRPKARRPRPHPRTRRPSRRGTGGASGPRGRRGLVRRRLDPRATRAGLARSRPRARRGTAHGPFRGARRGPGARRGGAASRCGRPPARRERPLGRAAIARGAGDRPRAR